MFLRVRNAHFKLKPSKCALYCDEVLYLGHVITTAGTSPDPSKFLVLASWPVPETVRDVQSFLGFVNFYGDFIDNATLLRATEKINAKVLERTHHSKALTLERRVILLRRRKLL